jgi:glycosyltransferase involved in cell wall biosynthesis
VIPLPANVINAKYNHTAVWVPSTKARDAYLRAGIPSSAIGVVPFGVDVYFYDPTVIKLSTVHRKNVLTFLYILPGDPAHDYVLSAFFEAFTASDSAHLNIITDIPVMDIQRALNWNAASASFAVIPRQANVVDTVITPHRFATVDCYIEASRAEWSTPLLAAMAMGIPSIVWTDTVGVELVNNTTAILLDGPGNAKDRVLEKLRYVRDHKEEITIVGLNARRLVVDQYSLEAIAQLVKRQVRTDCTKPGDT